MPAGVVIRGLGLTCALGVGVDACLRRLQQGTIDPVTWQITELDAQVSFPIYTFPGAESLADLSMAATMLERVVGEAIQSAGLSTVECEALPIFIGSSAFSLDREPVARDAVINPHAVGIQEVLAYQQVAGIVRRRFGCAGETYAYQTACTSSANAAVSAARMIRLGWFRHALVVGVEFANLATMAGFSSLQLIAPALKPFDRNREGIVIGEGIGAVVLSACDDGETGVFVRDGGSNIDSYRVTTSNPDGVTIAALTESLLERAGVASDAILGIKAHGTGSPMNDAGEAAVIRRVFPHPPPVCALKPYLGHTLGACGVNELVLMASALAQGIFPATVGFETPDPELGISPTARAGVALDGHYLLNYFGFGGHNTVMLVEKRS